MVILMLVLDDTPHFLRLLHAHLPGLGRPNHVGCNLHQYHQTVCRVHLFPGLYQTKHRFLLLEHKGNAVLHGQNRWPSGKACDCKSQDPVFDPRSVLFWFFSFSFSFFRYLEKIPK